VLIFSDLIFESRVDRGMPSLAAAPQRPDITSRHPRRFSETSLAELAQISARDEKSSRHFAVIHNHWCGAE
jgi:hypothetical protein